jgi:hypothetical protein
MEQQADFDRLHTWSSRPKERITLLQQNYVLFLPELPSTTTIDALRIEQPCQQRDQESLRKPRPGTVA